MKIVVGILAAITLIIWIGAGIRLSSATKETTPLFTMNDLMGGKKGDNAPASPANSPTNDFAERKRGGHLEEINEVSNIATSNPQSGTEYNANKAVDRAAKIEEGREGDLDDAKKKIGKIGK